MTRGIRSFCSAALRVSLVLLASSTAASHAQEKLSFRCTFGPGASANWDSGSVSINKGTFGQPNVVSIYDAIDLKSKTGRHIGGAGASDVVVLTNPDAITLFEQTNSGNLVFTTIFRARSQQNGEHIAVMSRHVSIMGDPLPSQYHGTCESH